MTLKYVQEHADRRHEKVSKPDGELHLEEGQFYLGDKPTGFIAEEAFSPKKLLLGVLATVILFVTDKIGVKLT